MSSTANKLNKKWVTRSQIFSAAGRFDHASKCYRFPDGSAGRVIRFRRRGAELPQIARRLLFIELKTVGARRRSELGLKAI